MKVFIVEDAPQTRQQLVELLTARQGLEVVGQAASVREALAGLEATWPDAMTLDISLPDGSGVEVLKRLHQRRRSLCVVVLTANPYEALRAKCHQLGAVAVLDKLDGLERAAEALLTRCQEAGFPNRPGP
ncbi:MAG: response regulator transcription factor [Verrucomicrobia bacterium]|nr:response regulator transcription factor [Verrucomicrobiota bacterium]